MNLQRFTEPFNYIVIDNFLDADLIDQLSGEFPSYDSDRWFSYENPLEVKKTINNWYDFPENTYQFFSSLNSSEFVSFIENITEVPTLYGDPGLHGAGWHIHGKGGKLNIHLDYTIHPKMNLKRKLNLILYMSKDWNPGWGGNLELWSHDSAHHKPKEKVAAVDCVYNRAVIFDSSVNSWHGFADPINCPDGIYRKSIAMYYLTDLDETVVDNRKRALYSPSKEQEGDEKVTEFIKSRAT